MTTPTRTATAASLLVIQQWRVGAGADGDPGWMDFYEQEVPEHEALAKETSRRMAAKLSEEAAEAPGNRYRLILREVITMTRDEVLFGDPAP